MTDAAPQYHCKVTWTDGTFFEAKLNKEHIFNLENLPTVADVEVGDEV